MGYGLVRIWELWVTQDVLCYFDGRIMKSKSQTSWSCFLVHNLLFYGWDHDTDEDKDKDKDEPVAIALIVNRYP